MMGCFLFRLYSILALVPKQARTLFRAASFLRGALAASLALHFDAQDSHPAEHAVGPSRFQGRGAAIDAALPWARL